MDYRKENINVLVSIVIPAHNEEKFIEKCLQSFLNQTYKNIEIIVVDDNSDDNTAEIVKKYPVKLIQHQKCLGEAATRSDGTKEAKGEIILHGEADAIYPSDYIEKSLKYFRDPEVMAVTVGKIEVLPELKGLIADYCRVKRTASSLMRGKGKKTTYGCHLFRKKITEKIGFYDPQFVVASDADFSLRIQKAKMKTVFAKDTFFYHRDPSTLKSFLQRTFKGNLFRKKFFEKWGWWFGRIQWWNLTLFFIWNLIVTLLPFYIFLSIFFPKLIFLVVFLFLVESLIPLILIEEFRTQFLLALKWKKFLLALSLPLITFLRIRAAFYGIIFAYLFSKKIEKAVSYEESL